MEAVTKQKQISETVNSITLASLHIRPPHLLLALLLTVFQIGQMPDAMILDSEKPFLEGFHDRCRHQPKTT